MSAKEKKRRKRERKWHIRWVEDQLAVFPLCVLYVLYMCREREIEEGKKKNLSGMPTSHYRHFLLLGADGKRSKVVV